MTWTSALPMYNVSPRVQREYEALLALLFDELNVPVELLHPTALLEFWRRPDLLLGQTCGYPYLTQLRGQVTLVATPCFDFPGCEGSDYSSVIVVRKDGDIRALADSRGRVAAANDVNSNSGMNVLRHAVAPLREGRRRFFESVKWSGSHAESLRMVRDGEADIAAIDCVTWGYIKEEDPASLQALEILRYSSPSPGLPLIAARAVPDELMLRLRDALLRPSPPLLERMRALHIRAFEHREDYSRIAQIEIEAQAAGYPLLA
jgi:ABC-type phosphate/phosphonate transport system substrate-binding protein